MVTSGKMLAAVSTAMLMLACGGSKSEPAAPQPAPSNAHAETQGMVGMCPVEVPGTKVAVADTQDGVALTFTTTGDVAQLRQRVHHMADMHEHMMHGGMMGSGEMMGSGGMGSDHMKMAPSTARAEDTDGGARIVLTPNDPKQLPELRAHVHDHAAQMASGHCPMRPVGSGRYTEP